MNELKISNFLNENKSDKCHYGHNYQFVYNDLFSKYHRDGAIDILESGIAQGGSLCAWKEYFPNAHVTGVDIVDTRLPQFIRDNVEFIVADIKDYVPDRAFDIIIEDGNHSNHDALWSALNLSKHLKSGGTLVIEDVQESYILPFVLWGRLNGKFIVSTTDLRRLNSRHDDFLVVIKKIDGE